MSIETPCFLYPVRFSAGSYDLVIDHGGTNEILNLTIEPDRDYWFSGDSSADDSSGNGDLIKWLEDSLNSTTIPGQSFTVSLSFPDERGSNRITVEGSLNFSILWDDAQTTLDALIFGSDGAATPSDLATTFSINTSGIWSPGYPPWTDSRDQQPISGALSRSVSGLVRGSFFGLPNKERDLMFDMVNREKTLEEFRDTDQDVHGTIEDLWIRAGCLGRRIRYYPDETDRDAFSVYRFRDSGHPFERSSIDPYHWTTILRLVLESTVEAEDGEEEEEEEGGGGGPPPIVVTQESNLTHWWKMPSPGESSPPGSILDVATNGSTRRDLSNSNITVTPAGRTLGSDTFDVYEFNGSSAESYQANETTFFGDKISISVWCKFDSQSHYEAIFCSGITNGGWNDGIWLYTGIYGSGGRPSGTLAWCSGGYTDISSVGASVAYATLPAIGTWFHVAGVIDVSAGVQELYIDGVAGTAPGSVSTPGTFNSNYKMTIGALSWGASGNGYYFDGQMSDFRIYHNYALSAADVASIYSGDFTP